MPTLSGVECVSCSALGLTAGEPRFAGRAEALRSLPEDGLARFAGRVVWSLGGRGAESREVPHRTRTCSDSPRCCDEVRSLPFASGPSIVSTATTTATNTTVPDRTTRRPPGNRLAHSV